MVEIYLPSDIEEVKILKTPGSSSKTHKLYRGSNGQLWLEKEDRSGTGEDFVSEFVAHHLFKEFGLPQFVVPEIRAPKNGSVSTYFTEFVPNSRSMYNSDDMNDINMDFINEVYDRLRAKPTRFSALVHMINDDYDRVPANYLIDGQENLVAIDHAGGWSGFVIYGEGISWDYVGKQPVAGADKLDKRTFENGGCKILVDYKLIDPQNDDLGEYLQKAEELKAMFSEAFILAKTSDLPVDKGTLADKTQRLLQNTASIDRGIEILFDSYQGNRTAPEGVSYRR